MKNYYIIKNGILKREKNTVYFEGKDCKKFIPINDINSLFIFGEIKINTKLLVFLSKNKVPIHFFNYYNFYIGSFYPKEYLNSGIVIVKQVEHYLDPEKRMKIAMEIVNSSVFNMIKNLKYYLKHGKELRNFIDKIQALKERIEKTKSIEELMGIEGPCRENYYLAFNEFLRSNFKFNNRTKQPPENEINCLISFGNTLLYTTCLTEIYNTQLNPTISYLHEPLERRFSLALDIAEIFKPLIVDKVIFNLINNRFVNESCFDKQLNFCYLNEKGKRIFLQKYDEKLRTTIYHKELKRKISYQHLIRIECYKLIKHLLNDKEFEGFKAWW